jgi:hypothetical protein
MHHTNWMEEPTPREQSHIMQPQHGPMSGQNSSSTVKQRDGMCIKRVFGMSSRISIEELTRVVGESLNSIDLRTASVRIDNSWHNVLTVLRASATTPEETTKRIEQLWREHGPISTPDFRIDNKIFPFSCWPKITGDFREGRLKFKDVRVECGRSIEVPSLLGNIQTQHNFLFPEEVWPILEVSLQTTSVQDGTRNPQYRIFAEPIQRSVNILGYAGPLDAISALLGARIGAGTISSDIYVSVPVMAKIIGASISVAENHFHINGCCDPALRAGLRVFGYSLGQFEDPRLRTELKFSGGNGPSFTASAAFTRRNAIENLEAKLVHSKIGDISWGRWRVRDLLPQVHVNPLYFLLKKFCPQDQLQSLLSRPHFVRSTKRKTQDEFERHIAWLLGCYGFSTVVLGEHEDLFAEDTRLKRGSLDLLAYHPARKLVVLGGCTLNVPKEEDYAGLLSVRSIVLEDWNGDLPFTCHSVMFSGAPDCASQWSRSRFDEFSGFVANDRVTVFDAGQLAEAVQHLQDRNEEEFFASF